MADGMKIRARQAPRILPRMSEVSDVDAFVGVVRETNDGTSTCVDCLHHYGWVHTDFDGNTRERRRPTFTTYSDRVEYVVTELMTKSGLDKTQAYNALNSMLTGGVSLGNAADE